MSDQNDTFFKIENLEVIYTSEKKIIHAVNGVSLELARGETLGLVGETGAGKTTIARSIMRILPDPPAQVLGGKIIFEGKDILSMSSQEILDIRGEKIAMIFQDPMTALNPIMSVGDQIGEVVHLHTASSRQETLDKAEEMLEMVGIPASRYGEYPFEFSGGMKQRVVIAMALACNPDLLLADEPTTALDVTIQAQILELINDLKTKNKTSMILITHDLGVVAQTCDKVAVIYAGEIMEYGDKKDIFLHPQHPYTKGLFASLPSMNTKTKRLTPIKGMPPDPRRLPKGCVFSPRCAYATDECRGEKIQKVDLENGHWCRCNKVGEG